MKIQGNPVMVIFRKSGEKDGTEDPSEKNRIIRIRENINQAGAEVNTAMSSKGEKN